MILKLVLRHLALHPIRSFIFVGAYAAGVAVMLSLLSIGEVMVEQSRDEQWIGGGDLTVLPAGVDLETLRTGGAVFYGIEQARFIAREVLGGPRVSARVEAVAPWIEDRAIYLRHSGSDTVYAVRANGLIPSAARALGAFPELIAGTWEDGEADRRWLTPTPVELYREIDGFHLPPARLGGDTTWAEWHYFNLLWPDGDTWLYLSYILAGNPRGERWGGMVLARLRLPDGRHLAFADTLPPEDIRISPGEPDVAFGPHTVSLRDGPARYEVRARLPAAEGGAPLEIDVEVHPEPRRYFPPAELASADSFVSGYVVPALRARASGRVCRLRWCLDASDAIAYHDHNWGTWGGVLWDWGVAHAGDFDVLYGGVHGPAAEEARRSGVRFLSYVVDSLGVAGVLEPQALRYVDPRPTVFEGDTVWVPGRLGWTASRHDDSLRVDISLERFALSRLSLGGDADVLFAQMQGTLALTGVLGGLGVAADGPGFFETYLTESGGSSPGTRIR